MAIHRAIIINLATSIIDNCVMVDTDVPFDAGEGFSLVLFEGVSGPGWLWDGTTATPPPQPPAPPLTREDYDAAIQGTLDAFAQSWGYTDLARAVTYVGDPYPQFNAEAVALRDWRSAVWVKGSQILATADPTKPPTIQEVLAQLPAAPARPVTPPSV